MINNERRQRVADMKTKRAHKVNHNHVKQKQTVSSLFSWHDNERTIFYVNSYIFGHFGINDFLTVTSLINLFIRPIEIWTLQGVKRLRIWFSKIFL